jgi:hypothetical protein
MNGWVVPPFFNFAPPNWLQELFFLPTSVHCHFWPRLMAGALLGDNTLM